MVDVEDKRQNSASRTIADHRFRIKKHLGQNFLNDRNILEKIVKSAALTSNTGVIEVGPGLGALTSLLAAGAKRVLAYEIDAELMPVLKENLAGFDNVVVLNRDILDVDIDADVHQYLGDASEVVLVANLPYYITTPILMRFLETSKSVKRMVLMMQSEVADRITSEPSTKDYNALTVVIRYRARTKSLFRVPRTVFIPAPNVDSTVIAIETTQKPEFQAQDETFFFDFVHRCFSQRRKTILNNIREQYTEKSRSEWEEAIRSTGIEPTCRAETLAVSDFVRLAETAMGLLASGKE